MLPVYTKSAYCNKHYSKYNENYVKLVLRDIEYMKTARNFVTLFGFKETNKQTLRYLTAAMVCEVYLDTRVMKVCDFLAGVYRKSPTTIYTGINRIVRANESFQYKFAEIVNCIRTPFLPYRENGTVTSQLALVYALYLFKIGLAEYDIEPLDVLRNPYQ